MYKIGSFFLIIFLSACATMPQTNKLISSGTFPSSLVEIKETPFFPQEKYQCGPAALAVMLNSARVSVTPEDLVSQVYIPERKGSLQLEMISATRSYNQIPYILQGRLSDLLTEVAQGHPVLVLQNLSFDWIPVWHYAVVVGFDIKNQNIILRSGVNKRIVTDMSTFERTWVRAKHWAMVVLPPNELPATAQEFTYIKTVFAFEQLDKLEVALIAYNRALSKWPNSLTLHLALGNLYYQLGQLNHAESMLSNAITVHPQSATAHNNLAHVLLEQNKLDVAYDVALKAVKLENGSTDVSQKTLQEIKLQMSLVK